MKVNLLYLSLLIFTYNMNAQITFNGCSTVLSPQNYVLSATGITTDGGIIRNTFESTPADFAQSCSAGVCEVRIIWNITSSRWEIQLDNDGPIGTPDYTTAVIYFNTTVSSPNPPDLSLGTWVDSEFCGGEAILKLSGDVQGSTLGLNDFETQNKIKLFPNPSNDFIEILGLNKTQKYRMYTILGTQIKKGEVSNSHKIEIKNLTKGVYFLILDNGNTLKFIKR